MLKRAIMGLLALCVAATPIAASAADLSVKPVDGGAATIRYYKGTPSLNLVQEKGGIQITPTPMDHGSLTFQIAAMNLGEAPANFGVENIRASIDGEPFALFTKDELDKRAKNRAKWRTIALAAAGGLAAAAASTSGDRTYTSTTYGPRGATYRTVARINDPGQAALATGATVAATGAGIYAVQNQLDNTLEALADEILQTTTIDPEDSYGGTIVLNKLKRNSLPAVLDLEVDWNGETYKFAFNVAK